ncbi:MAG: hypothetical protein HY392_03790 [Candidatus Diapherotrites archaeon]|nr:hypothetical protein [Candidatus Diapherotrites archaeon]
MANLLLDFLGDNPNTRLLEFLITGREFDYSLTDMAKNAGIGWSTLHRILPRLLKQEIIIETREIGRAKLFKLNQKNEEVKKLTELYDSLLTKQLEEFKEKNLLVMAK